MQPDVDGLEAEIALLTAEAQKAAAAKTAETDRNNAADSQARAVQTQVAELETTIRDLQTQADSLDHLLATAQLSTDERATTSQRLETMRTELQEATAERDRLMADGARPDAGQVATDVPDHSDMLARYRALQTRI